MATKTVKIDSEIYREASDSLLEAGMDVAECFDAIFTVGAAAIASKAARIASDATARAKAVAALKDLLKPGGRVLVKAQGRRPETVGTVVAVAKSGAVLIEGDDGSEHLVPAHKLSAVPVPDSE